MGKRFTYDALSNENYCINDNNDAFVHVHRESAARLLCIGMNSLHRENEAFREVVDAAKDVSIGWHRYSNGFNEKAGRLLDALKKLNPPTPEELLTARLEAADDLADAAGFEGGYDSRIAEVAVEKYKTAKQAHENG